MDSSSESKTKDVNCFIFKHFYITWEKNFPRGCKALGFKSVEMPFNVVSQSSGLRCLYFEQKDSPLDVKKQQI